MVVQFCFDLLVQEGNECQLETFLAMIVFVHIWLQITTKIPIFDILIVTNNRNCEKCNWYIAVFIAELLSCLRDM